MVLSASSFTATTATFAVSATTATSATSATSATAYTACRCTFELKGVHNPKKKTNRDTSSIFLNETAALQRACVFLNTVSYKHSRKIERAMV